MEETEKREEFQQESAAVEAAAQPVEVKPVGPTAEEQIASLKDQHLRALAEVENVRRRAQKEKEDASKFAISSFAREILGVVDNFQRALAVVPVGEVESEAFRNLRAGVEATERQMLSALERFAIKPLAPVGLPFDPNFHRVMMEVEDASHPTGTVVQVLQSGYMIGDRLLREALVAVSKGGAALHAVDTSA